MDKVLSDTLKANLKSADTTEKKLEAIILAMIAVVDCQYKTSQRTKRQAVAIVAIVLALAVLIVAGPDTLVKVLTILRGGAA